MSPLTPHAVPAAGTSSHRPDIVVHKLVDGRWLALCLTCKQRSAPSAHKPVAEDWRIAHIKQATRPTTEPLRSTQ